MSIDEDDELAELRRRAYSPSADISDDPDALRRLVELESRAGANDEDIGTPADETTQPVVPTDAAIPAAASDVSRRARPRLVRSRVLVISAGLLIAATWVTSLLLVQNAQTDPLRAGVEEVTRLTADPGFTPPAALYRGVTGKVTGYDAFEGFRAITYPSFREGDQAPRCMTIWQPDLLEDEDSGLSYGGESLIPSCGAGAFPASYTILLTDGSAERALTDLPPDTALQFVYDEARDEIVVFRG